MLGITQISQVLDKEYKKLPFPKLCRKWGFELTYYVKLIIYG
jgi:hypothetical protein